VTQVIADDTSNRWRHPAPFPHPLAKLRRGSHFKTRYRWVRDGGLEQNRADPIGAYIEGAPGGDTITVRELGGMRCGSFNYTETEAFRAAITNDPRANYTPDSPREVALL
jgi:hypothetical protein